MAKKSASLSEACQEASLSTSVSLSMLCYLLLVSPDLLPLSILLCALADWPTDWLNGSFTLWFPGEAAAPCSLWGQWKILEADGKWGEEWDWIIISWACRLWFIKNRLYPSPKASAPVSWSRHDWTGAGESWKRAAPADSIVTAALFLNVSRAEVSVALRVSDLLTIDSGGVIRSLQSQPNYVSQYIQTPNTQLSPTPSLHLGFPQASPYLWFVYI